MYLPGGVPSAQVDRFVHDRLPPRALWPVMDYAVLPELAAYPPRLNAATVLLDQAVAAGYGQRPVLHYAHRVWTYGQLLEQANRLARVLVEDFALVPGNRVLLRAPNTPMLVACWFAVLKAGGICVTTMPLLRARELAFILEKAQVRLALCDTRLAAELEAARARTAVLERIAYFTPLGEGGSEDADLEARAARKAATFANVDTAADDVALIAFTSGTTGQAKGTVHFHRDVLAVCDCFPRYVAGTRPDDVFCGSPPLAFTFGLGALLLFPMRFGASAVLLEQFSPEGLLQAVQDYRATALYTAPTAYRAMLPHVSRYDLSSLRQCVSAGETLPLATFEAWRQATGLKIIDGLGSTEMLHIFVSAAGDAIRPGATGKAIPGYTARVVDAAGNPVPPGTPGLLAVRGPTGCRYLDNLERQRAYVQQGWNLPGDVYLMDADGYFWYQARADDMIISAGYNIAGPEVENVLLEHPKVQECAVIGAPDPERGQIVKAYVVLRNPAEAGEATVKELQDFVKAQLAPYKYPRAVVFVDRLPRTETGKLQRFKLREAETAGPLPEKK
ncbi:MAG: 2-aminobenzoate-CoA ligase [Candidatus Tectimicrobiota bacterium]|nr:MAG: 2-aminobenzoate-CoA ligase [Candidatus Tectomicrobia bacterium]